MLTSGSRIVKKAPCRYLLQSKNNYAFWAIGKSKSNTSTNSTDILPDFKKNELPLNTSHQETQSATGITGERENLEVIQAPNRATIWSRSQNPRREAMTGPRFEQTLFEFQPAPLSAIELSHRQPVKWVREKVVSCDGGGGPLGHPRIFINTDKPEICVCEYCGRAFANEKHREHLEALKSTPYPLKPLEDSD